MLKTRVITALVLLAVLLALFFFNSLPAFEFVLTLFFAAGVWEGFRLFQSKRPVIYAALLTAVLGGLIVSGRVTDLKLLSGLCAAVWALRLAPSLAIGLPPLHSIGDRMLTGIYAIAIFGCFIAILALFQHSPLYLFSVMSIVWIADIGAYFSGKAFGKHKLAISISPGKSWEGAIGGWLAVLLLAAGSVMIPALSETFAVRLHARWGWAGLAGVMTLLVAFSVIGDLFESQLKRRAGMKDSSNLLPGHGGVLDRIDALIPVLPLAILFDSFL
jgi:phosphatidate cytidylyltransferase